MRKIILLTLASALVLGTFSSCKKGENDPAMSLKTRKARLTGEWKLTDALILQYEDGQKVGQTTYDGTHLNSNGDVSVFTLSYEFAKDGTYSSETVEDGERTTEMGNWAFTGKSKDADLKKKEGLVLGQTSYVTSNYSATSSKFNLSQIESWELDRLTKKELVMKQLMDDNYGGETQKMDITLTFTKK